MGCSVSDSAKPILALMAGSEDGGSGPWRGAPLSLDTTCMFLKMSSTIFSSLGASLAFTSSAASRTWARSSTSASSSASSVFSTACRAASVLGCCLRTSSSASTAICFSPSIAFSSSLWSDWQFSIFSIVLAMSSSTAFSDTVSPLATARSLASCLVASDVCSATHSRRAFSFSASRACASLRRSASSESAYSCASLSVTSDASLRFTAAAACAATTSFCTIDCRRANDMWSSEKKSPSSVHGMGGAGAPSAAWKRITHLSFESQPNEADSHSASRCSSAEATSSSDEEEADAWRSTCARRTSYRACAFTSLASASADHASATCMRSCARSTLSCDFSVSDRRWNSCCAMR
mmetsp:Transcript_28268/g.91438  ORF Transcript_28268/g.91438 Transcript_28268/m.91438 type:complete len:351 (-) Transcript_28268:5168-6220(-)